tara:strand:- start:119 stop:499 length:381 start_codon:yes stop_codon:yes gene_type:complete
MGDQKKVNFYTLKTNTCENMLRECSRNLDFAEFSIKNILEISPEFKNGLALLCEIYSFNYNVTSLLNVKLVSDYYKVTAEELSEEDGEERVIFNADEMFYINANLQGVQLAKETILTNTSLSFTLH